MTVDWSEWITNVYAISPIGRAKLICLDYETNLLNFGPLEDNRNGELTFGKSYDVCAICSSLGLRQIFDILLILLLIFTNYDYDYY